MLLEANESRLWVDICPKMYSITRSYAYDYGFTCQPDFDGYWTVFLRKNFYVDNKEKKNFLKQVISFLESKGLLYARISLPQYDRLIIFTSSNKLEIYQVKKWIQNDFNVKSKNMIWKTYFESDYQWKQGNWCSLLDEVFSGYENQLKSKGMKVNKNIAINFSRLYQKILEEMLMKRESMLVRPVFKQINYDIDSNLAFVLMAFAKNWSDSDHVYHLIKQVGERAKFNVKRADDLFEPNIIIEDIWTSINRASIIIADISIHNANVFYELGIAHTLGKKVILIKQKNDTPAPFDIIAWRYIEYSIMPKDADVFKDTLEKVLIAHRENPI